MEKNHWPERRWSRALMSLTMLKPKMWSYASSSLTRKAVRPMTTASSHSQSSWVVRSALCRIGWPGPVTAVAGLPKRTGRGGRSLSVSRLRLDSSTCSM